MAKQRADNEHGGPRSEQRRTTSEPDIQQRASLDEPLLAPGRPGTRRPLGVSTPPTQVLALQRTVGNQRVQRMLAQQKQSVPSRSQHIQRLTEEERQQLLAKQKAEREQEIAALGAPPASDASYIGAEGGGKDLRMMSQDPRFQAAYKTDRASDTGSFFERTKMKVKDKASEALKNVKEKRLPTSNFVPGDDYETRNETLGDKAKRFGKMGAVMAAKKATDSLPVVGAAKKVAGAVQSHQRQKVSEGIASSSQDMLTSQIASGRADFHKQQKVDRGINAGAAVIKDALTIGSMGAGAGAAEAAISLTKKAVSYGATATRMGLKTINTVQSTDREARLAAQLPTSLPTVQQAGQSLIDQVTALPSPPTPVEDVEDVEDIAAMMPDVPAKRSAKPKREAVLEMVAGPSTPSRARTQAPPAPPLPTADVALTTPPSASASVVPGAPLPVGGGAEAPVVPFVQAPRPMAAPTRRRHAIVIGGDRPVPPAPIVPPAPAQQEDDLSPDVMAWLGQGPASSGPVPSDDEMNARLAALGVPAQSDPELLAAMSQAGDGELTPDVMAWLAQGPASSGPVSSDAELEARLARLNTPADPDAELEARLASLNEGSDFDYPDELLEARLAALQGSSAGLRDPASPAPYLPQVPEDVPYVDEDFDIPVGGRARSNAIVGGRPPTQVDEDGLSPEVAAWLGQGPASSGPVPSDEELEARLAMLHSDPAEAPADPDAELAARLAMLSDGADADLPEDLRPENLPAPGAVGGPELTVRDIRKMQFPAVPKPDIDKELGDRLAALTGGVRAPEVVADEEAYLKQLSDVDASNTELIKLAKADPEFGKALIDHLAAPQMSIGKELAVNKDIQKPGSRTTSKHRTGRVLKTTVSKVVEEHNLKPSGVAKQAALEKARLRQRERMGASPTWSVAGDAAAKKADKAAAKADKSAAKAAKKSAKSSKVAPAPVSTIPDAPALPAAPAQAAPKENVLKKLLKNEKERFFE